MDRSGTFYTRSSARCRRVALDALWYEQHKKSHKRAQQHHRLDALWHGQHDELHQGVQRRHNFDAPGHEHHNQFH